MVFTVQDGVSRYPAENYNVLTIVMIRYWFFALFVLALSQHRGGVSAIAKTSQPVLQIGRGILLAVQIYCLRCGPSRLLAWLNFRQFLPAIR